MSNDVTPVIDWLKARHAAIMADEAEALGRLKAGDTKGYNEKMRAKAEAVAALAKDAAPVLAGLPEARREPILRGLMRFSQSAAMGLKLGSVFYMSALLYPDDHKPGEPDNLALFIEELAAGKARS
ncbi:MAG: hypothetical protein HDR50_03290 [Desulfovibrio sp.]|uniref:hypothetical protein n=1 Tax=Desulfovibrio sp. TaxID=885 RepID=UPI001A6C6A70|nr:hypothetical protein [Desulfovibrio sp.]MBD5416690.1 hypothetical protein [Desulfovibrio sp.]